MTTLALVGPGEPEPPPFGPVVLGDLADQTVAVGNTGTATLTVSSLDVTNGGFTVVSPAVPFTVGAGATVAVTIRFEPTVAPPKSRTLKIASDDPDLATIAVPISGSGLELMPTATLPAPCPA